MMAIGCTSELWKMICKNLYLCMYQCSAIWVHVQDYVIMQATF